LPKACDELDKAARDLRLVFKKEGRMPAIATENFREFAPALKTLSEKLAQIGGMLEKQAERSEGLENCWQRAQAMALQLKQWQDDKGDDKVRWLEVFHHSLQLNSTPLSIAEIFGKQIESCARAWIFTSATLAVKQDFSHYQSEMGLLKAKPPAGTARSIMKSRPCCMCRRTCRNRTAKVIPRRWCKPPSHD